MAEKRKTDRLSLVVNIAILITLAIVLVSPSGVLGSRLLDGYRRWQINRALQDLWPVLIDAPSTLGVSKDGEVATIVEFVDYECPSCRRVAADIATAITSTPVRVVIRHLPLEALHPQATRAALAAICSESQGVFAEAHTALLSSDDWRDGGDWIDWAKHVGVQDTQAFRDCLADAETAQRLEADMRLAESLRIVGTPTFVTMKGVFPGERGFAEALANTDVALRAQPATVRSFATVFESEDHSSTAVSSLGRLARGMFVSKERIVLLDGQEHLFLDFRSGALTVVGASGEGPGEFRGSGIQLVWFPMQDKITVWDVLNARLSTFAESGNLLSTSRVDLSPSDFLHPLAFFRLWGIFDDGDMAFIDVPSVQGREASTPGRPLERLVRVTASGDFNTVVEFLGAEPREVLFGHRTYVEVSGSRVFVADTQTDSIRVFHKTGVPEFAFAMPGEERLVQQPDVTAAVMDERERDARGRERRARLFEAAGIRGEADRATRRDYVHNDVTPRIDDMQMDSQGRLWTRWYVMPGDDVQRWSVWDDGVEVLLVELPVTDTFMDARDELILVRVRDELGVDRAIVRQMLIPPTH